MKPDYIEPAGKFITWLQCLSKKIFDIDTHLPNAKRKNKKEKLNTKKLNSQIDLMTFNGAL